MNLIGKDNRNDSFVSSIIELDVGIGVSVVIEVVKNAKLLADFLIARPDPVEFTAEYYWFNAIIDMEET